MKIIIYIRSYFFCYVYWTRSIWKNIIYILIFFVADRYMYMKSYVYWKGSIWTNIIYILNFIVVDRREIEKGKEIQEQKCKHCQEAPEQTKLKKRMEGILFL